MYSSRLYYAKNYVFEIVHEESVKVYHLPMCVCVCFFPIHSGHQVRWTYQPGSHRQEEGHTGFLIHLPSAVRALIFVARILCTNELIVLHPLGIFILVF